MKTLLILTILVSVNSYAQSDEASKKLAEEKSKMDYGDKQLLKRDTCRKPIEALETKYPNLTKAELEKMKANCTY